MSTGFVLDTPEQIDRYSWKVLQSAVRMEQVGLKGRINATAVAKRKLGLKRNASRDLIIAEIEKILRK